MSKTLKKALVKKLQPTFNQDPIGDSEIKWVYKPVNDPERYGNHMTIICRIGKSEILGCISLIPDYKPGTKTLDLIESRVNMPMIAVSYRTKDGKVRDRWEKVLMFPIDEEDEEDVLNLFDRIAKEVDITKLQEFKPE